MKVRRVFAVALIFSGFCYSLSSKVADPDCTGPSPGLVRAMLATLT